MPPPQRWLETPWKRRAALLALFALALALRVPGLDRLPDAVQIDEPSVGLNAWLIAEGGIDQYGEPYPILFRALDDYKGALYIYTLALFLKVLPLSLATIRLPAALYSACAVFGCAALTRELTRSRGAGLVAAALFAASPRAVILARYCWQGNALIALYPLTLALALRWLRKGRPGTAAAAGALLGLCLYTYAIAKLLCFLTALALLAAALRRRGWRDSSLWAFVAALSLSALPFAWA